MRRIRRSADFRRGHLLMGAAGRVVRGAALRLSPDIITTAKGMTSAYSPMGAVIASDRIAEPFLSAPNAFLHGITFGGHPVAAAVALANIDVLEREGLLENVRANEGAFRDMLESLRDIPIVGDVRGAGYFRR